MLPCPWSRRGTLGRAYDDGDGAGQHAQPQCPEQHEHEPAQTHPERILRILHQFFLRQAGELLRIELNFNTFKPATKAPATTKKYRDFQSIKRDKSPESKVN